jgi:hypothetical protein
MTPVIHFTGLVIQTQEILRVHLRWTHFTGLEI